VPASYPASWALQCRAPGGAGNGAVARPGTACARRLSARRPRRQGGLCGAAGAPGGVARGGAAGPGGARAAQCRAARPGLPAAARCGECAAAPPAQQRSRAHAQCFLRGRAPAERGAAPCLRLGICTGAAARWALRASGRLLGACGSGCARAHAAPATAGSPDQCLRAVAAAPLTA